MTPIVELGGDAVLDGDEPQLLEPRRFLLQEPTLLDVGQRRASPQAERLAQQGHRVDPVSTALRPGPTSAVNRLTSSDAGGIAMR